MQVDVQEVVPAREDLVEAVAAIRHATEPEVNPHDPPIPVAELRTDLFARTTQAHLRTWLATVDGEPAGEATFELEHDDENRHVAGSEWVAVRPDLRRRGVADALLRRALDDLADDGRTSLMLWAPEQDPDAGGAFAERLGLDLRLEERCSRVQVREIDDALVDEWVAEGEAGAGGYRLVQFEGHCPAELLPAYLGATVAMDDMPTDDLDWVVAPTDEDLVRSREQVWRQKLLRVARTMAVGPDGDGAGYSELFVSTHRPTLAYQGDTGVVPAHRGRGLGRWLKAANLRYAQAISPGFEVVETYNAQSNPWMLDINVAMGFRPHVVWRAFQGDLAAARAVVSTRRR